jgi:hypothetical protein
MGRSDRLLRLAVLPAIAAVLVQGSSAGAAAPRWHQVNTPNPSGQANYLSAVTIVGPDDVWAVGAWVRATSTPGTLTEHWNGSKWSVVSSPNATQGYNELYGVSAVSTSDVWAVGYHNIAEYGSEKTMIEHWDGARWRIMASPNIGQKANFLYDVAAIGTDDVWAVGQGASSNISTGVAMAQHWDGSAWSVVTTPNVGTGANTLYGVTALATDDVWAVGESKRGALVLHYDGSVWSVVPGAEGVGSDSTLYSLAAASPNDVWAVGYSDGGTLVEHWDGATWTVVASPNGAQEESVLSDVSIDPSGSGRVWAVGTSFDELTVQYRTLTELWDGSSWRLVPSPNPDRNVNGLQGVAWGSDGVWAAGSTSRLTVALRTI